MSAAGTPNPSRLQRLFTQLEEAAFRFPGMDAVVIHRPDLRRDDTVRQVREGMERVDASFHPERGPGDRGLEARAFAQKADDWIPPELKTIEQAGGRGLWRSEVLESVASEPGRPSYLIRWRCEVFLANTTISNLEASRLFDLLATDAANLILPEHRRLNNPAAGWLVYLGDWEYPADSIHRRRQYLYLGQWPESPPRWNWLNPRVESQPWWAVRIGNVFRHSRDAVAKAIDLTASVTATTGEQTDASTQPEVAASAERNQGEATTDQVSAVARAIAIMYDHHKKHRKLMTVPDLLTLVPGASKSTLYRDEGFKAARAAIRQSLQGELPKGYAAEGRVEAEDYDNSADE